MKSEKFHSLTATLTIALLALSLTTLLISSGMQAFFSYQDRQNIIIDQQNSIAQKAADEVRKFIDAKSSILDAASHFTDLTEIGREEQKLVLEKLLGFDPSFRQVVLLDAKGQELEIASRLSNSASGNLSGRTGSDMLSLVGMGRTYISPVYIDEVTSEPMIVMAVPATDVFGDFKGLLIAEVNLKFMWDMIDRMKIGKSGTAYVVDRQGTLIAYSDISLVLKGEKLIRLKEVRDFIENPGVLNEKDAELTRGIKETNVFSNFISLGTPDWAVITEIPVSEAYEPIIQQFKITLLIVIANILLVILIAGYISKRITKPIMVLNNAANEIGKGNFNPVIRVGSNDEIGQLASAFNTMARELKKTTVSKDYVENILKSMFDMLVVTNPDGKIQIVNQAICDLLGYRSEELKGEFIDRLIYDEVPHSESSYFKELDNKDSIVNIEKHYLTKDGRKIPVLLSMSNMYDDEGNKLGVVCVARDITERKRAEDLLNKSKEFAETVLGSMKDAISIIDVNNFRITDANSVFLKNYGMKKEEVIGKSCHEITHKRTQPCIPPDDICPLMDTLKSGEYSATEHVHHLKDGEIRYVEVSTSPIMDENGRMTKVIHITHDITDRKLAEVKIKASLEEKEVLLREIHHRVKNNMQIVASLLNLQSQNIEDKKYKNLFIDSQTRIYSMALIHENLYQSESLAQINLKEYIDGIVSNLFESYGHKSNIKLEINVENILINIDNAVPCGLIINELVTNSFKYAFPDGRQGIIKISVKSDDNNTIQISISDNGIGIPKDLDIRNTKSLGLRLIIGFAESQLHGEIILNRDNGTEFQINFRQKNGRRNIV
jgi:PAS domain S-box-containing protein